MFSYNLFFLYSIFYLNPMVVYSEVPQDLGVRQAEAGEFRFIVSIQKIDDKVHVCGGIIYTLKYTLTSARCIADPQLSRSKYLVAKDPFIHELVAGSVYTRDMNLFGFEVRNIENWFFHPKTHISAKGFWSFDLGLVKLVKSGFESNWYVYQAPLVARTSFLLDERWAMLAKSDHITCKIAGWGRTFVWTNKTFVYSNSSTVLKVLNVKIIGPAKCKKMICPINKSLCNVTLDSPRQLCILPLKVRENTCMVDSGSPLVCSDQVWAIGNYVLSCGDHQFPAVFTLIGTLIDFANENILRSSEAASLEVYHICFFINCVIVVQYFLN